MAVSMNGRKRIEATVKNDRVSKKELLVKDFIELHTDFVRDKMLENLAPKTINDHKNIFKFLVKWIDQSHWSDENQYVSKSLFLDYKEYMMFEKNYAPCTVNVRLRPIKAYINWLLKNEHLNTNFNNYIKLVKVAEDRVHPLTKPEIKKLINAIGNYTYARFRDLTISICILDCGIRIGELLQLTYHDVSFSKSYIIVRAEVSKTRTERVLPISRQTLSHLEQLKDIAIEQNQTHLFLSTTGEKVIAESDVFTNRGLDWGKVYPSLRGTKVDYNAQKLARSSINHAYQTSTIKSSSINPFIEGIEWQSAMIHGRTCQLCIDRHEHIYYKGVEEPPLDHPQGFVQCYLTYPNL